MAKLKCDILSLGLAIGIVAALYFFLIGVASWLFDWGTNLVYAFSKLYLGYTPSLLGSIIGAAWAFVDGFVAGILIAWLYNKFAK